MESVLNHLSAVNLRDRPSSSSPTSSPSGERLKNDLLKAAYWGDLPKFKSVEIGLLNELEVKDGLAETIVGMKDVDGRNFLHVAVAGGSDEVCKYLVEEVKLDLDLKDEKLGETALHYAIMYDRHNLLDYLLENGANPNVGTTITARTPLHYAAEKGPKKLVKLLIAKGAEVNALIDCGSPLLDAAFAGKKECVEVLLDNHANPNVIIREFYTPLMASIAARSVECVKLLLEAGADPNLGVANGMPALVLAASDGLTEIIKCLLNAGADPNATDEALGITPIEAAAWHRNHQNVEILLPVTSPIPKVSDWSYAGLVTYVHSKKATKERQHKSKKDLLISISKGEEAISRKDYLDGIYWYTKAKNADPTDAVLSSNRSFCWACAKMSVAALTDAEVCIRLRPDWPKGYYRAGVAWMLMREFEKAADAFYIGLSLDRNDEELKCAFREAIEAQRDSQLST